MSAGVRQGDWKMEQLKIGIIGLDTSHVAAFAKVFNWKDDPFHIPGAGIIRKAYPGGSRLFSESWTRVEKFTVILRESGAEIVGAIADMADMDAFLLTSCDGRQHPEQFRILAPFGKPVFIDKPFACSYADALEIVRLAEQYNTPVMTASSIRYAAGVSALPVKPSEIAVAETFGPLPLPPDYRDYFWYGIHSAELLYSYLGTGCESVRSVHSEDADLLIGNWKDGRLGFVCGCRKGASEFGVRLTSGAGHAVGIQDRSISHIYTLTQHLTGFLKTGKSPVDPRESLEIMAFLEAASRSLNDAGRTVHLNEFTK